MLPEKIKICGFDISVKMTKNIMTDRCSRGEWHPRIQEIHIDPDHTEQQEQETFLHEVVESINDIYDLKLEHHIISLLGTSLHQFLRDNDIHFYGGKK